MSLGNTLFYRRGNGLKVTDLWQMQYYVLRLDEVVEFSMRDGLLISAFYHPDALNPER